tara:strand:+ start:101 stop:394 length:294 start_codon:yes stop_codon:yes gene_type:complete
MFLLLMKKFFEGNLSLPLSFWAFGFLGSAIVGFIGMVLTQDLGMMRVVALPWHIFIVIGIWRSSNNYKGSKIFSILAKVMLVVWSLNFIAGLMSLTM